MKNVMVFVKDLAGAVVVEEHHSWIRCLGSSGERLNIKGLRRSLSQALDRRFVYDLQQRRRNT